MFYDMVVKAPKTVKVIHLKPFQNGKHFILSLTEHKT
jgi:hypothetical protein